MKIPYVVFLSVFLLHFVGYAGAQLYYKDIVSTHETNELLRTYRTNKVKSIVLVASNADDSPAEGFDVRQELNASFSEMQTITGSDDNASVLISKFDTAGRIQETTDSSAATLNHTIYEYDDAGALQKITSVATDSSGKLNETETREFFYNTHGIPDSAIRSTNGKRVATILFKSDDKGNVIEETPFKNGAAGEKVLYYYNSKGQMTDIVRFNERVRKLLPDYLFEYDNAGRVAQKITVPGNTGNYLIWRYQYNDGGLKVREAIFTRSKQLTGKILYQYSYFGS